MKAVPKRNQMRMTSGQN